VTQDAANAEPDGRSTRRRLAAQVIPAAVVGVASGLALLALTGVANILQTVLWDRLPPALGIAPDAPIWIIAVLTAVGIAVGLVVTFVPGHAGPDPATLELAGPPLPVAVLPSLALAVILSLAGGVSLGPENPILGITVALSVFLGLRVLPGSPVVGWAAWAVSGTLGAMFGTPVAAALMLSEQPGDPRVPLWDRMFSPLVAAGAGALTMDIVGGEKFAIDVVPYPGPQLIDLLSASVIAVFAALVGLAAVYLFPVLYRAFRRLGPPLITLALGGFILGILGAIGGPITLFKGLEQMKQLSQDVSSYTAFGLASIVVIKLVALLVSGTSGFRGGRIFPSVFIAVALGLCINVMFPGVPQSLAVAASLLGLLVAITRSGWLALFMAALMVGETQIIPVLCIAILPAWLLVTGRPEMVIRVPRSPSSASGTAPG
jgi:H+/Cl- antiporter ClcA